MKFLAIFFLVLSCSRQVQSECKEFNLLANHPRLKEMAVQNQGSFNTCYAHSLAGAYEAKTGQGIHPYSVAYEHKQRLLHWRPYDLDYSLASMAWGDVVKKGVCSLEEVNKRLDQYRVNKNYNDDQVVFALKAFFPHKNANKAIKELKSEPFEDGEPWTRKDLAKLYSKLKSSKQKKFFSFLGEEVLANCEKVYPKEELISQGLFFESNQSLADAYIERLSQNEASVVGYCSHHMRDEDFNSLRPRAIMAALPSCGAHYTMIVGQKKIANTCQVLIKNSHNDHFWGRDNQTCLCKGQKGKLRLCEKRDFDRKAESVVGCYFHRERFLSETFDISYLK